MQRDLTDSTTQRNVGVAFGHAVLAYTTWCGPDGIEINAARMAQDLDANSWCWARLTSRRGAAAIAGAIGMAVEPHERLQGADARSRGGRAHAMSSSLAWVCRPRWRSASGADPRPTSACPAWRAGEAWPVGAAGARVSRLAALFIAQLLAATHALCVVAETH